MIFTDRVDAGRRLATALRRYGGDDVVVFGLARGGVVTAAEVAKELAAPLDVIIVRQLGHPLNLEYAIGAVAEDGEVVLDLPCRADYDIHWLQRRIQIERTETRRRREVYLGGRPPIDARAKTAIVVDDGIATGLSMKVAINEVSHRKPARIVVAVPIAPDSVVEELRLMADDMVVLNATEGYLGAVAAYYKEFYPVLDHQVVLLLDEADARMEAKLPHASRDPVAL